MMRISFKLTKKKQQKLKNFKKSMQMFKTSRLFAIKRMPRVTSILECSITRF